MTHAVFLRNNVTSESIREETTPNQIFVGIQRIPEPKGVFGCLAFAKIFVRGKQEPKGRKVIFLGHSEKYQASMVRSISSYRDSLREYYARDVVFDVTQFPYKNVLVSRPQAPPLDLEDEKEEKKLEELKVVEEENQVELPVEVVDENDENDENLPELFSDSSDEESDNEPIRT